MVLEVLGHQPPIYRPFPHQTFLVEIERKRIIHRMAFRLTSKQIVYLEISMIFHNRMVGRPPPPPLFSLQSVFYKLQGTAANTLDSKTVFRFTQE